MFNNIYKLENLLKAYYFARRGKRNKPRICLYDFFLESNLIKLRYFLTSNKYLPSPYAHFVIYDPKTRQVAAPAFRDRVLQHSLVSVIEPLFEKKFIYDSYACRKGKGTHFGAKRIKKFLMAARCINGKEKEIYVLQCDINKFFQSISWSILLSIISKTINCRQTVNLIEKIITTHVQTLGKDQGQLSIFSFTGFDNEAVSVTERRGLPIGNLTSQLFANIYLNELDHFAKEVLRERWYARYMDDFLIIHPDKNHLLEAREKIKTYLKKALNLRLHSKKLTIKNVREGVPFVGYRIFYDHILIRGSTLSHMQKKYKKKFKLFQQEQISQEELRQTICSIRGHLNHANAHNLYSFMIKKSI